MSSILKALRKLEEEKARRNAGSPDIARDILKSAPRRKTPAAWMTPLLGALVFACALAGYVLMEKPEPAPLPMAPVKNIDGAPTVDTPSLAKEAPAVVVDSQPVERPVVRNLRKSSGLPVNEPAERPSRPATTAALPEPTTAPVKERFSSPEAEMRSIDGSLPKLLLSGIAYQEERGARLAVVNDLPVMEGTMIEGARVEEISQDRVRFVYTGRSFHLSLGQSTEAK
jgi:general secretion pathway protein B